MSTHALVVLLGLVIALSVGIQVMAARLQLPGIVLLLTAGILLGPEVFNLMPADALGRGLRVLIPLMVAIIVFEGGMALDMTYLRHVSTVVRNLITIGCLVTAVLATLTAWLLMDLPFPLAAVFGSLVSVTGPTVINPLLRRAPVTQKLKTILMAEGVLIDAVGAILAVVVLEMVLARRLPWEGAGIWLFRLLGGTVIGGMGGWLLARSLRYVGTTMTAELTRLTAVGGALGLYALAEAFRPEAGIAAVAAAGIIVGNQRFPHEEEVHHLEGDLTTLAIGVIFILLAARLRLDDLLTVGWRGLATVLVLMLVIRPLSVFLAAARSTLHLRERLFLAAVGPRGIVAAAFATFAALRLEDAGYTESQTLVGLVFLLIMVTVVVQSFTTPWIARLLGVQPMQILIIGADEIGRTLAHHLHGQREEAVLIDRDGAHAAQARHEGLTVIEGDATQEAVLRRAGIGRASQVVATTSSDKTNLLVCQVAKARFQISHLVARVNDAANMGMFSDLGIRAMSPTAAAVMVLDTLLRRPNTLRLLTDLDAGKDVREVMITNPAIGGKSVADLAVHEDVLLAVVRRDTATFVPHGSTILLVGDSITLIGGRDDVATVAERFSLT